MLFSFVGFVSRLGCCSWAVFLNLNPKSRFRDFFYWVGWEVWWVGGVGGGV